MLQQVEIEGIVFEKIIDAKEIEQIVANTAEKIKKDYENQEVIFLVVLNGAFVFASDLLREYDTPCFTYFIKVSSYDGMQSTNEVKVVGLPEDLKGKNVVLIEDSVNSRNIRFYDSLKESKDYLTINSLTHMFFMIKLLGKLFLLIKETC